MKGEGRRTTKSKWKEWSSPKNEELKSQPDSTYISMSDFCCRAVFLTVRILFAFSVIRSLFLLRTVKSLRQPQKASKDRKRLKVSQSRWEW